MNPIDISMSVSHAYLIPCKGGYLQIDTGYEWDYPDYRRRLQRAGVGVEQIRYVFLTHHHDDHSGFLNDLVRDADPVIIAHGLAKDLLRTGRNDTSRGGGYVSGRAKFVADVKMRLNPKWTLTFKPFLLREKDPTVSGDDDRLLRQTGVDGRILYTPGHSIDHLAILLDDGSLFCGDAAASYPPLVGIRHCAVFMTDMEESYCTWKKVLSAGARTVFPTHGRPFPAKALLRDMGKIRTQDLVRVS